ncbi:MAG: ABC transporter permease [Spirochaetaceae bacterium]|jgi:peptide/nickel transport system permease protein|nr:ABC transporter permease [Spirochaetaceae bacterium]
MRRLRFILYRILQMIPILLVVSILAFVLSNMSAGDVATITIRSQGEEVTAESLAAVRQELGLDNPLPVQYLTWLGKVLRLDFGASFQTKKPVTEEIFRRFPATLKLAFAATLISVLFAIPIALLCARYRNSPFDHAFRIVSACGTTIPDFWLGLMLLYAFAVKLHLAPVVAGNKWQNIFLPALTLSVNNGATYIRLLRENLIKVRSMDYMRAARARGLSEMETLIRHGIKNAMLPCITLVGVNFGKLLSGMFACETIFSWNGIGKFAVDSIRLKDIPVIQGYILVVAVTFIGINLLLDIMYLYIDPKIQIE